MRRLFLLAGLLLVLPPGRILARRGMERATERRVSSAVPQRSPPAAANEIVIDQASAGMPSPPLWPAGKSSSWVT